MVKEFGFGMAFGVVMILSGWFGISPRVIVFASIALRKGGDTRVMVFVLMIITRLLRKRGDSSFPWRYNWCDRAPPCSLLFLDSCKWMNSHFLSTDHLRKWGIIISDW